MSTQLPTRLAKQIAGDCCYSGCTEKAVDGADYCAPHDAVERSRVALKQRQRRQKLAAQGLCRDGCGRKVKKRRKVGGKFKLVRCGTCKRRRKKADAAERKKQGVSLESAGVPSAPLDPHFRIEHDKRPERAGQSTVRYVGKSHRGRLSREEQIAEDQRDAQFAIDYLKEFVRALSVLKRGDVLDLPAVQRSAAHREAAQFPSSAARICDDLAERYGGE